MVLCNLTLFLLAFAFHEVCSECSYEARVAEFHLVVEHKLTMTTGQDEVYARDGNLYTPGRSDPVSPDDVIVGDAVNTSRAVIVVNGTMPGPAIEVYENQIVVIHVTNNLLSDGISIHWHGYPQKKTPWFDGAAFTTQCPILPGQSFTYTICAQPKGTYFYHGHAGAMTSMGFFGAFVVKEKKPFNLPEHVLTVQDWSHETGSDKLTLQRMYGIGNAYRELIDGTASYAFGVNSGLINGRGRYFCETGEVLEGPLSVFSVRRHQQYRFRVIGAMAAIAFRMSVDRHRLTLVAIDGRDIRPIEVESFIINSGERLDFILNADQPVGSYWLRGESLHAGRPTIAKAVVRYEGAEVTEPTTTRTPCTGDNICKVASCPFPVYPGEPHIECISVDSLREPNYDSPVPKVVAGRYKEHFLNFAYQYGDSGAFGTVNGIKYKFPSVNALLQPKEITTLCNREECGKDKVCECTNSLEIGNGDTIQFVFTNLKKGIPISHPIHMHGHTFHVLKVGFPQYDASGKILARNADIECEGDPEDLLCSKPVWTDKSWYGDNIPGLNLDQAPRKDTIVVPAGGYVIVRIVADNPGLWNLHCHMEAHSLGGMNILLNESFSQLPTPPPGLPQCRGYPPPSWLISPPAQTSPAAVVPTTSPATSDQQDQVAVPVSPKDGSEAVFSRREFWAMFGVLVGIVFVQFLVSIGVLNCVHARASRRSYHPGPEIVPPYKS